MLAVPLHEIGVADAIVSFSFMTREVSALAEIIHTAAFEDRELRRKGQALQPGRYPGAAKRHMEFIEENFRRLKQSLGVPDR